MTPLMLLRWNIWLLLLCTHIVSVRTRDSDDGDSDDDEHHTNTTQALQFANPKNTSTCDSTTFFWTPTGGLNTTISLLISNMGVPNHTESTSTLFNSTLTSAFSTDAQLFTWMRVNVPQGWYMAQALLATPPHTVLSLSAPFFVSNGSDTSCLPASSNAGGTSNSSTTSSIPSQTASAQIGSSSPRLSVGEIVSTALGIAAALIILILAFLFPRLWRRALPSSRKTRHYALY